MRIYKLVQKLIYYFIFDRDLSGNVEILIAASK